MRKLFIALLLLVVVSLPTVAHADLQEDLTNQVEQGLGNLDFSQVDTIANGYIGNIIDKIQRIINGEFDSVQSFLQMLFALLGSNIASLLPKLISIFVVLILVGLMRKTSGGFISQSTDNIVSFVGRAVVLVTLISLFTDAFSQVNNVLSQLSLLCDTSMPILLTLIVANGSTNLSAVCQPSMVMFSGTIISIVRNVLVP